MGVEITGKMLGLIGCGNIGSIVADRAKGLKMRVIAYDPFLSRRTRRRDRRREGGAERPSGARRLHHPARPDDGADQEHPVGRKYRQDQEGRAHHQLRPRRPRRRRCPAGGAGQWPCRRRRASTCSRGAGDGQSAVRPSERRGDAASGRLHQRSAGECRAPGRRADVGLSDSAARSRTPSTFPRSPRRRRQS